MSVVVAIKKEGKIYLGADTQATTGQIKDKCSKIWLSEEDSSLAYGSVGTLRNTQLVRYSKLITHSDIIRDDIDTRFIVLKIFDKIYSIYKEHGVVPKEETEPREISDEYIIVYEGNGWKISCDGCVEELSDYLVMGSGKEVAIGVLEANRNKEPKTRIAEAIKTVSENTIYVNSDIEYIVINDPNYNTENKEGKKR